MTTKRRYFGTDGIRGKVGTQFIHPEFVLRLGFAVGKVFAEEGYNNVLIGKDTRISGYMFESALEAGLSAAGVDISLLGPMPTPAVAYLTRTFRAAAGIVISASHNAFHDNGIKFFSSDGTKLPDAIELDIEAQLEKPLVTVPSARLGKAVRIDDAPGRYIEFCKSTVASHTQLSGLKVVVDCANGATYHVAPSVFQELGADVIEMGVSPNGLNINENCGSTFPETLREMVLKEGADVGVALDGDGDRLIMVDHRGDIVDGDECLYIIAKEQKNSGALNGSGVVGTIMSNMGIEKAISGLGVEYIRGPVGDRYIIDELYRRHWTLGGESSGHIICLDKTTTGDGIVAALQVLFAMVTEGKTLHELKSEIEKYPQSVVNVKTIKAKTVVEAKLVQQAVANVQNELGHRGRVVLRPSGTEPVVRVMVEGDDQEKVDDYANHLAGVVKEALESL